MLETLSGKCASHDKTKTTLEVWPGSLVPVHIGPARGHIANSMTLKNHGKWPKILALGYILWFQSNSLTKLPHVMSISLCYLMSLLHIYLNRRKRARKCIKVVISGWYSIPIIEKWSQLSNRLNLSQCAVYNSSVLPNIWAEQSVSILTLNY